ncbi:MFS transporter, partial [Chloroflexota bacterium]
MKETKVFYGYWVLVASFLFVFISQGCGFFAFSLFVKSLQEELGWGRGEIMAAFTMFILALGVGAPFIGRLVDRYGVKRVISTGAIIAGSGYVLLSQTNALWHYYLGYLIIGIGIAATGVVPASTAVSNWFKRKRGMAIGIMSSGVGAGGLVLAPIIGGYLIPNFGWRTSYLILALLIWVVIIPVALLVIKAKPADMGLYPDGAEAPEMVNVTNSSSSAHDGLTLKMALATPAFWLIAIG